VCRAGRHLSDGQQLTIAGEAYRLIDRQRNSEVRLQFRTAVASFADDLMNSAEQRDRVQRLKDLVLNDVEVESLDRVRLGDKMGRMRSKVNWWGTSPPSSGNRAFDEYRAG
jgi:hypothetical protein